MRQVIRAAGEIFLTSGVIGLLFISYLIWGTALRADSAQRQLSNELNQEWRQAPARGDAAGASPEQFHVATGQPFAFITIPALGPHWRFTLIQGTALAQLDLSPGHVPGTQWPGQAGNFAVAGHRVTAGNPFWSLPSLQAGDLVYIQTRLNQYTYRITGKRWVLPTDLTVLDPVPGHPAQRPVKRLITLITCDPAWTGTHRVIVTGVLVSAKPR
ncbi:MAG TPA: class E sortase [Streptosporangiaceae bacterium]|nr:class E sortase [Streptosporangiaceae bacterium]